MKQNDLIVGSLCAVCCEILYGMSYIFTKQATEIASVLSLLSWRFFIAFLIMNLLVAIGLLKIHLKGKNLKSLFWVVFCCPVIYFTGETIGIQNTIASESGVFLACIPVASLIASTVLLHKKPALLQATGIVITLIGVLITIFAVSTSSSFSFMGYFFLCIAVTAYSLYCVFVENAKDYTEIEITYCMLLAGAFIFIVLACIEASIKNDLSALIILPFTNKKFLFAVLYQGIGCSVFAFFLSNMAIIKIGVNRTASFIGIATLVSIITGIFILNETVIPFQIAGAAVIIIGVYVANISKKFYTINKIKA